MTRFSSASTLPRLWAAGILLTGCVLCPSLRAQSYSAGSLTLGGSSSYSASSTTAVNVTSLGYLPVDTAHLTLNSGLISGGTAISFGTLSSTTATVSSGTLNVNVSGGTVVLKATGGTLTVTSKDGTLAYTATGTTPADAVIVPAATPAPSPLPTPWNGSGRSIVSVGTAPTGAAIFHAYSGGIRRWSTDPGVAVATGTITLYQSPTGKLTGSIFWNDTGKVEAVTGKRDLQTGRGDFIQRGADGAPAAGAMRVPFHSSKDGSLLTGGAMADNGESLAVRLTAGQ